MDDGKPELVLYRYRIGQPVSSHGGPAASLRWSLVLNGVTIINDNYRVRWEDRLNPLKTLPSPTVRDVAKSLEQALGVKTINIVEKELEDIQAAHARRS